MHPWKIPLVVIVVVGGLAVLGSYVHGAVTNPGKASALWGGVPPGMLPAYTVMMFLAAAGYLAASYLVLFRLDPGVVRLPGGLDYRSFYGIYAAILVPSALWMPLTIAMVDRPGPGLWILIRIALAIVGLAALGLFVGLLYAVPRPTGPAFVAALAGSLAFFVHTGILDALVWPAYFPR